MVVGHSNGWEAISVSHSVHWPTDLNLFSDAQTFFFYSLLYILCLFQSCLLFSLFTFLELLFSVSWKAPINKMITVLIIGRECVTSPFFAVQHQMVILSFLILLSFLSLPTSRWRYGSKIKDPNTRRSWRTGHVDLKENTLPPHLRHPPPRHARCGTSAWPPKGRRCTREDTWTILLTGTLDTNRIPCRGLRWCERREGENIFKMK